MWKSEKLQPLASSNTLNILNCKCFTISDKPDFIRPDHMCDDVPMDTCPNYQSL